MNSAGSSTRHRGWIAWMIGFVLAFGSLVGWSFASAPGSSPDDDFHLASIWCGLGEQAGRCEASTNPEWRQMPAKVLAATCHAYRSEIDASCMFAGDLERMQDNSRGNWIGLYPPAYYTFAALFVGPEVGATVITIRIFNSALFLAVIALLLTIGPPMLRRFAVVAPLVTTIPLGAFIIASINPSSWAITSAVAVSGGLILLPRVTGWRQWAAAGLAIFGAFIGSGARSDSAITTGVAVVVALILGVGRDRRTTWLLVSSGAVAIAIGAAYLLSAGQSNAAVTGLSGTPPTSAGASFALLASLFFKIPALLAGVFGSPPVGSLGWFDVSLVAWVWVAAGSVFVIVIWLALRSVSRRRMIAIAFAAIALYGYALALQVQSQKPVGDTIQPRYVLPLLIVLAIAALADVHAMRGLSRIAPLQLWVPLAALAIANAMALYSTMHRYVNGDGTSGYLLDVDVGWWWTLPPAISPTLAWLLAAGAYAALLAFLAVSAGVRKVTPAPSS